MSDQVAGKLTTQELHRLLDLLRAFVDSGTAKIVAVVGEADSCGNPIHLDGPDFLAGFAEFLKAQNLDAEKLIADLSLCLEISTYVRAGGIRAMAYRLETSYFQLTPDYFGVIALALCCELRDGKYIENKLATNSSLRQRLSEISPEDEMRVSASIAEIDEILLSIGRKLEDVSDALTESKAAGAVATSDNASAPDEKQSGGQE